jgi:effector-binding domain-containing protein
MKFFSLMVTAFFLTGCSVFGVRGQTGEPTYSVIDKFGDIEVRRYQPRLAADTIVEGEQEAAINAGFRRLADFIFGENTLEQEIAMTAPVEQRSETIAMTTPVSQEDLGEGMWRIRFYMPENYTLDTLPKPNNPEVEIVTAPVETYAVIRFTGSRRAASFNKYRIALLSGLHDSDWHPVGPVNNWFFDPPWTIPWLRRNEVAVPVAQDPQ